MTGGAVLITGASGGIGKALCATFYDAGYKVIATSRSSKGIDTSKYSFISVSLEDLVLEDKVLNKFKKDVLNKLEGNRLTTIVNNAAVQILGGTSELTAKDFQHSFNVNTLAPFLLIQNFLPELEASNGSVLNIGTVHATATKPEFAAYATTKTAMHGLTRALAVDLGGRIRINTLAPAATATPMLLAGFEGNSEAYNQLKKVHPIGRIARPKEIGQMALFLCSNKAEFITGATFYVDGGILSRLHDPV